MLSVSVGTLHRLRDLKKLNQPLTKRLTLKQQLIRKNFVIRALPSMATAAATAPHMHFPQEQEPTPVVINFNIFPYNYQPAKTTSSTKRRGLLPHNQPESPPLEAEHKVDAQTDNLPQEDLANVQYYLPFRYRLPSKVDQYALGEQLGKGNFATVYRAETNLNATNDASDEDVAVKRIKKDRCPKQLFVKEFETMRYLSSHGPEVTSKLNLARDVYETNEDVCFVLDLCKGGDLFDYIIDQPNSKVPEHHAKIVVSSLFQALYDLHSVGVVHRDVKPENILLKEKGNIEQTRVTDFGYATVLPNSKQIDPLVSSGSRSTLTKDIFRNPAGTFGYVAPEVLRSLEYTTKCDTWSAGCVLYVLLTGQQPFTLSAQVQNANDIGETQTVRKELRIIEHGRNVNRWRDTLETGELSELSVEAKHLLSGLLEVDPKHRLSAKDALNHPWFSANSESVDEDKIEMCS